MTASTDLDLINADLMTAGVPNAFGRDAQRGDTLSGEIVAVERRHRRDSTGQPLYWVDRKPSPIETGQPVIDNVLIVQTDARDHEDDDGQRSLRLDRDVKKALSEAIRAAGEKGIAIGGRIEGFMLAGHAQGGGRIYDGGTYTPPTA
ncbi:hypothetical protein [Nocardia wallacei]|uniref:hypothetical protein n=1 Tax=Nocardia wallacei TaxID=480035 RepID=UPI00245852B8|nr:hypothetical protein [Nocardia wallacei]